ncbi:MAG TPA: hypothetical protein VGP72_31950 [Planctomycetota bacterium]
MVVVIEDDAIAKSGDPSIPHATSPDPTVQKAKEAGTAAYAKAREATGHAVDALKILISDPLGGQGKACSLLGDAKAFQAGIVFGVFFLVSGYLILMELMHLEGTNINLEHRMGACVLGAVPVVALTLGCLLVGRVFGGKVNLSTAVFSASVALLPFGIVTLAAYLLGFGNIELVGALTFFGICATILLLNASLLDIQKLSTQKAFVVTPSLILLSSYIAKVIFAALIKD